MKRTRQKRLLLVGMVLGLVLVLALVLVVVRDTMTLWIPTQRRVGQTKAKGRRR